MLHRNIHLNLVTVWLRQKPQRSRSPILRRKHWCCSYVKVVRLLRGDCRIRQVVCLGWYLEGLTALPLGYKIAFEKKKNLRNTVSSSWMTIFLRAQKATSAHTVDVCLLPDRPLPHYLYRTSWEDMGRDLGLTATSARHPANLPAVSVTATRVSSPEELSISYTSSREGSPVNSRLRWDEMTPLQRIFNN